MEALESRFCDRIGSVDRGRKRLPAWRLHDSLRYRTYTQRVKLKQWRQAGMNLTIELTDDPGAAMAAKAVAQGVSLAGFTRHVLEEAVKPLEGQELKPKKSAYGLLAKYGPGPPEEEIDENRREMFSGFAQDVPW